MHDPPNTTPPFIPRWYHWCISAFFAAPALFLGAGWIYTFGFTDFRAHYRLIGLPLGLVTFFLGVVILFFPILPERLPFRRRPRP